MPVFHLSSRCTSGEARGARALQRLAERLQALAERPMGAEGFEGVEREVHGCFAQAEREVLGEALERLDVDVPHVEMEGQRHHRVLRSAHGYTTAAGPVTVERTLYRCGRGRAVVPVELRAGMVEGHWTPLAARQASRVVAQMTPQEGEALLRELGNMAPSKSSLDPLPKGLGARWEAHRERFETALREASAVPEEAVSVAVSLDGVMVPMKDAQRAQKRERSRAAGRRAKGPAGYSAREAPAPKAHRRGLAILPRQPLPHALRRHRGPEPAHRLRRRRRRPQNAGHPTPQTLRNALAPRRRAGNTDPPCTATKYLLRSSLGVALRHLSSRSQNLRQRARVSQQMDRVTYQFRIYTQTSCASPRGTNRA